MGIEERLTDPIIQEILELLISAPQGLSFSSIVRALKRPKQTISNRLKLLVSLGYLNKERVGKK